MNPSLRLFLSVSLFLSTLSCWAKDTKNVLFLIADDLNTDLGCYDPAFQTPNIDRLAAKGVLFERAYCQNPLCNPSRASLFTGRRSGTTKVYENRTHFRDTLPDTVTLPQLFRENGYFTARVGKIFHRDSEDILNGTAGKDDPKAWDLALNPRPKALGEEESKQIGGATPGKLHAMLISWLATKEEDPDREDCLADGLVAEEAINILGRQTAAKPFFLAVGLFRPHTPYVAPKEYFDLYPLEKISLPPVPSDHIAAGPPLAFFSLTRYKDAEHAQMTDDYKRQAIQAYHASTSFMDRQVGRILEALEKSGLADNTIVVFTSDHGYHLGEHGLWHKRSLFERGARVPLIIDAPGAKGNGHAAGAVVESVDLYPTLADLCGLKAPSYLAGTSLVPVLNDPKATVKECAVTEVENGGKIGCSLRTPQYRYTEWDGGKEGTQLYDQEKDPQEFDNLAANPAFAGVIKDCKAMLAKVLAKPQEAPDSSKPSGGAAPSAGSAPRL